MSGFDTLALLSLSPQVAMQQFIAHYALSDLAATQVKVLEIIPGAGTLTVAVLGIELEPGQLTPWKYGGSTQVQYHRLDVHTLFQGLQLKFNPPSFPTSTAWICQQIAAGFQINFDPADFVQEEITQVMAGHYMLRAAPDSLRYIGQVPIYMLNKTLIEDLLQNNGQPVVDFGNLSVLAGDYGIGALSPNTNGTYLVRQLRHLAAGYVFVNEQGSPPIKWGLFNRILNAGPINPWSLDGRGPALYNGYGATVTYNGPIDPNMDRPYNTNLDQVCRIRLSPTYCTNYVGTLSIYYSLILLSN